MTRRYYTSPNIHPKDILVVLDTREDHGVIDDRIRGFRSSDPTQILGLPGSRLTYHGALPTKFFQSIGRPSTMWKEVSESFIRTLFAEEFRALEARFKTKHKLGAPKGKLP